MDLVLLKLKHGPAYGVPTGERHGVKLLDVLSKCNRWGGMGWLGVVCSHAFCMYVVVFSCSPVFFVHVWDYQIPHYTQINTTIHTHQHHHTHTHTHLHTLRRSVVVDRPSNLTRLVSGNCSAVQIHNDAGVAAAVVRQACGGGQHPPDFIVAQLLELSAWQQAR